MNDALAVSRLQSFGNLKRVFENLASRQSSLGDLVRERAAFEQFHGYEWLASIFPDVVNGANVRMIQCRGGPCFPAKAVQGGGMAR